MDVQTIAFLMFVFVATVPAAKVMVFTRLMGDSIVLPFVNYVVIAAVLVYLGFAWFNVSALIVGGVIAVALFMGSFNGYRQLMGFLTEPRI